jgi:hypothetical protein
VTTLARQFETTRPPWSPAVAAREVDRLMSLLPTSLLEALLNLGTTPPVRQAR